MFYKCQLGIIDVLFAEFNRMLEERGIITHKGTIVDATFVDAPRQRNSRDENKKIKNGEIPEEWENEPHKLSQKDTDARWTKKGDEKHYGYKDHVKVDADSKLILDYAVTPANVHDATSLKISLTSRTRSDMPTAPTLVRSYPNTFATKSAKKATATSS